MNVLPRLIACDIDGTLLTGGATAVSLRLFPLIRRLQKRGVLFCPASGRQYHSLRGLFAPVADELYYLCENGSILFGPGPEDAPPVLSKTVIPRTDAMALAHGMLALPGCEPMLSGQNTVYIPAASAALARVLRQQVGNRVAFFAAPEDVAEEIVKISAYCPNAIRRIEETLRPGWEARLNVAVAGAEWLDFTPANKGTGLRRLCRLLGVETTETLAIGDNWNDVPMLDAVGRPFIMSGAAPALLARYPMHCDDVAALLARLMEEAGA